MKRVMLQVAYDGTGYCGWQIQPNGITIEEELNKALSSLTGESIKVIGASRTDSGVHARCNVAVFDTASSIPSDRFSYALNQRLPEDIRIQDSREVCREFHPRYCASKKTYRYSIWCGKFPMPTERLYSYDVSVQLDVAKMQLGAKHLVGEHDFKSFCASHTSVETTVRTIHNISIRQEGDMIAIEVSGNGFLYNMVRIIAGTLIQVGKGIYEPEEVEGIRLACDRRKAGPTAPAKGLMLYSYEFL